MVKVLLYSQEQESLMRRKTLEYLAISTITLTSLAQLLGKISNMVINDHIQQQVQQALHAVHQVWIISYHIHLNCPPSPFLSQHFALSEK